MFEKFLSDNAENFRQRYEGTYGFYRKEDKSKLLVQLNAIREHTCVFTDAKGLEYKLNADTDKDIGFEFIPPKSGYFNTAQGAMLVNRVAARQFQRGVSGKNIRVTLLNAAFHQAQRIGFPLLSQIYENAVPTKNALEVFEGKHVPSVAVSPQLALDNANVVWLLAEAIGTYLKESGTYKIKLNDPSLWRTELMDAFRAINTPVEIAT